MSTIPAKQIIKLLSAFVRANNFSASGSSTIVTTPITTALSNVGDGGVSVPLQVATAGTIGVITAAPANRAEIYNATSKDKISAGDEEVYGRITESGGVYTLSYFTLSNAGIEAAYSFPSATPIDFEFSYRFDFARLPADAITSIQARNISNDPALGGAGQTVRRERLTVTGTNTIANLTQTPIDAASVSLIVNGISYDTFGGAAAAFSINLATRAITWNPAAPHAQFNIETDDRVIAQYSTTA